LEDAEGVQDTLYYQIVSTIHHLKVTPKLQASSTTTTYPSIKKQKEPSQNLQPSRRPSIWRRSARWFSRRLLLCRLLLWWWLKTSLGIVICCLFVDIGRRHFFSRRPAGRIAALLMLMLVMLRHDGALLLL
jgi:hypothetical protein